MPKQANKAELPTGSATPGVGGGLEMGIGSTEETSVRVLWAVLSTLWPALCLCEGAHQLWVFIDMLFLCSKHVQGQHDITSLPGSQSLREQQLSQRLVGKGIVSIIRMPHAVPGSVSPF